MKVGIVGSRRRVSQFDRQLVDVLITNLVDTKMDSEGELIIVSGGCPTGADSFAEEIGLRLGLTVVVHPVLRPGDPKPKDRWEFTKLAYARNRRIAQEADSLYALVAPDRTGGTENTLSHARELGKPYLINDGTTEFWERDLVDWSKRKNGSRGRLT